MLGLSICTSDSREVSGSSVFNFTVHDFMLYQKPSQPGDGTDSCYEVYFLMLKIKILNFLLC